MSHQYLNLKTRKKSSIVSTQFSNKKKYRVMFHQYLNLKTREKSSIVSTQFSNKKNIK